MSGSRAPRSSGCLRIAGFGCGGLLLLVIVAAVLVAVNLDRLAETSIGRRITRAVDEGKEVVSAVQQLRPEIQEEFATDGVNATMRYRSGHARATLALVLQAPPFLPDDPEGVERTARDVARFAARRFKAIDRVEGIVVRFERPASLGIVVTSGEEFTFSVAELLDDPEPGATDGPERTGDGPTR